MNGERRKDYPDIKASLIVIEERIRKVDEIHEDLKEVKKILNGNGKIGLVGKVENLIGGVRIVWIIISGVLIKIGYELFEKVIR